MEPTYGTPDIDTRMRVSVDIANTPLLYSPETDENHEPVRLTVFYRYTPTQDAQGWWRHTWATRSVHLYAIGDGVSWTWSGRSLTHGVASDDGYMPSWVSRLVDELRPSGEVAMPRVKGH